MSLKDTIKNRRIEMGLTAKFVAQQLNISTSTYFEWEQGRKISGEAYYLPLCKILNLSLSELLTGSKPNAELEKHIDELHEKLTVMKTLL